MNAVENIKRFWPFLLVIPLAAAAVAGWFVLPDELVVQIGVDGLPSKVWPKLLALPLPVAVGVFGAWFASDEAKEKRAGGFIVLAVAAVITVFNFAMNL